MALAAPPSKRCSRYLNVETMFACIVLSACACSILIAHMSAKRIHRPHHKININIELTPVSAHRDDKHNERVQGDEVQSQPKKLKSVHPHFKGYIIENPDLCREQKIDILLYFHSEVSHYETRIILRETWANKENLASVRVKPVFFLGEAARPEDGPGVLMEQERHGDIIQGDFLDTFRNLSRKAIMASHWISSHCAHARYVIKSDDDIFLDIFRIVQFLIPKVLNSSTTIMCHRHTSGSREIQREPKGRWYVPETLLPGSHFPEFCSGYFVLMTSDVLPLLYKGTRDVSLISVDDAFLFGLSAKNVKGLKFVDISKNTSLQSELQIQQYKSGKPVTILASVIKNNVEHRTLFDISVAHSVEWVKLHAGTGILKLIKTLV